MDYDFSQLDDKEFEELAIKLLSEKEGKNIDRFPPGRDGGVDGRFFTDKNKEIIIQCKQYLGTGYKGLVSKIKNIELDKVKKLKPKRYIFLTDLPLTRIQQKEIKDIFSPYIKNEGDILCQQDLNDLLQKYPNILEGCFKLWIDNTHVLKNVLSNVINNSLIGRSDFSLKEIIDDAKYFVETKSFNDALEKINKDRVIIIAGEAGIGKTTLSKNLCLRLVSKHEYKFFEIKNNIEEAEQIRDDSQKQLFFYDDFLGTNYFESIENNKDSNVIKFINRVNKSKNKIFILNSRTTILNNGKNYSTIFRSNNIEKNEYLLKITDLNEFDKANILYKHFHYSKLNDSFKNEIIKNKNYYKIIRHKNFNPRLIEFITDDERIEFNDYTKYLDHIYKSLDYPNDIWEDSFNIQANEYVRNIVSLVVFNGGKISEDILNDAYTSISANINHSSHLPNNFNYNIKVAVKSFLSRMINENNKEIIYGLFNPSIGDFVLNNYLRNKNFLIKIFTSLKTPDSLKTLNSLKNSGLNNGNEILKLEDKIYFSILEEISNSNIEKCDGDYILTFLNLYEDLPGSNDYIIKCINYIIGEKVNFSQGKFEIFLNLIYRHFEELDIKDETFLILYLKKFYQLDSYEIECLGYVLDRFTFIDTFENYDDNLLDELKEVIEGFVMDQMREEIEDLDCDSFIEYYDNDYDYDLGEIENHIIQVGNDAYEKFYNFKFMNHIGNIDIKQIRSRIDRDIEEIMNDYISDYGEDYNKEDFGGSAGFRNYEQDIDDLFCIG